MVAFKEPISGAGQEILDGEDSIHSGIAEDTNLAHMKMFLIRYKKMVAFFKARPETEPEVLASMQRTHKVMEKRIKELEQNGSD